MWLPSIFRLTESLYRRKGGGRASGRGQGELGIGSDIIPISSESVSKPAIAFGYDRGDVSGAASQLIRSEGFDSQQYGSECPKNQGCAASGAGFPFVLECQAWGGQGGHAGVDPADVGPAMYLRDTGGLLRGRYLSNDIPGSSSESQTNTWATILPSTLGDGHDSEWETTDSHASDPDEGRHWPSDTAARQPASHYRPTLHPAQEFHHPGPVQPILYPSTSKSHNRRAIDIRGIGNDNSRTTYNIGHAVIVDHQARSRKWERVSLKQSRTRQESSSRTATTRLAKAGTIVRDFLQSSSTVSDNGTPASDQAFLAHHPPSTAERNSNAKSVATSSKGKERVKDKAWNSDSHEMGLADNFTAAMTLVDFCHAYGLSNEIKDKLDAIHVAGPHTLHLISDTELQVAGKLSVGERASVRYAQSVWTRALADLALPAHHA